MIIYLYGPDTFRSRQKLSAIIEKFKKEIDPSGINIDRFDAKNLTAETINKIITAAPFMANRRLVVVEGCAELPKNHISLKKLDEDFPKLTNQKIVVLFWDKEIPTPANKYPLITKLKKEKLAQEFNSLKLPEAKKWANQQLSNKKIKIEPKALDELVDRVGSDLWRMDNELQKLSALAKQQIVTLKMVQTLTADSTEENVFALTDAISNQQTAKALELLEQQLRSGTPATEILGIMTWQFRNLLLIKTFIEENGSGYPAQRIADQLGIHPFVIKKTINQASRFNLKKLTETYRRLAKTDFTLKTNQANAFALLDLLVIK